MNPSTALAQVLVDELVRGGVREAVLAPGSRSAPLAYALHEADRSGRLRLHVRIDERSAAFLALGLAKASGTPVPVVTTSGTATANLHPAVLEAFHSGVPLIVLTADRPPELRGRGANQTIDQTGLYGTAVQFFAEVGVPEDRPGQNAAWRAVVCRALAASGPAHLNLAFREPLVPTAGDWPEPLAGRPDGGAWTATASVHSHAHVADDLPDRTVVVLGDGMAHPAGVTALVQARGFPVLAEPTAGWVPNLVAVPELLLTSSFVDEHRPDRVLVVGRPTLSRAFQRLIGSVPADIVSDGPWPDATSSAARILPDVPEPREVTYSGWLNDWIDAGRLAEAVVEGALASHDLTEPGVAAAVLRAVPAGGQLVVGSSKPVRDLGLAPIRSDVRVLANRGVAGIDGMVSTAIGAALGTGLPTIALLGDLTFVHDSNGLVLGPEEPRPDLTIVVTNNDGGAIFGTLEQAGADGFERVFGTPHGTDLGALCAASGVPFTRAASRAELTAALTEVAGLRVVEVRTDRAAAVALDAELHAAVRRAV